MILMGTMLIALETKSLVMNQNYNQVALLNIFNFSSRRFASVGSQELVTRERTPLISIIIIFSKALKMFVLINFEFYECYANELTIVRTE